MRIELAIIIGWLVLIGVSSAQEMPSLPDEQQILVWAQPVGGGGSLLLMGAGEPQTVLPLSSSVSSVAPCGVSATSPDGRLVAFSVTDGSTTNLYQMRDNSPRLASSATTSIP